MSSTFHFVLSRLRTIFVKTFNMRKAFLFIALAIFASTLLAQKKEFSKTITVSGSAEMDIVPDEIYVTVELKEYTKKGTGKISIETIKADFLGFCKQAGLPDSVISISSYQGSDNSYWYQQRKSTKVDLNASIAYQIKFSNSKTMDDLVMLLDDDATTNFRITRTYHTKMPEYRKQLKILAVKAAREKANYLAEAINEKAGEAVEIEEPDETSGVSVHAYSSQARVSSNAVYSTGSGSSVDFKKMRLRFEVSVVFALQ